MKNFSKSKVEKLLGELEQDLLKAAKEELVSLKKADEDAPPAAKEETPPAEEAPADDAAPAEAAPKDEAPAEAPPEDPAAEDGGPLTPEMIMDWAQGLSMDELKMVYSVARNALQAKMATEGGMAPPTPDAAPPAPAAPVAPEAAAPAAAPEEAMAMKSEVEVATLVKSEVDAVKAQLTESFKAEIAEIKAALSEYFNTPVRKAATTVPFLSKNSSEKTVQMTDSEIRATLLEKSKDLSLSKKDRSLITSYCVGNVSADAIAHLLA